MIEEKGLRSGSCHLIESSLMNNDGRHITNFVNPVKFSCNDKCQFLVDLSKKKILCRYCKKEENLPDRFFTVPVREIIDIFKEQHINCKKIINKKYSQKSHENL